MVIISNQDELKSYIKEKLYRFQFVYQNKNKDRKSKAIQALIKESNINGDAVAEDNQYDAFRQEQLGLIELAKPKSLEYDGQNPYNVPALDLDKSTNRRGLRSIKHKNGKF